MAEARCSRCAGRRQQAARCCCAAALVGLASACGEGAHGAERPWCHLVEKYANLSRHDDRRLSHGTGRRNGISFVLSGYNVFKGNPSPTRASVDPGFQHEIFEAQYSGDTTTSGRYQQPTGITLLPCDGACSEKSVVQSISGVHTYLNALSAKVEFDIQGFGARFGASFDYQRLEKGYETLDEVYTMVEARCCSYEAQLDSFAPPPFTADFMAAAELMPVDYDQAQYFLLIREFGTHYLSSAQMGGVYGQESTFKRSSWQDMISSAFEWNAYAQASFLLTINADAGGTSEKTDSKEFTSYSESQQVYSVGQKPPASGKWTDWVNSDIAVPAPIKSELRPLSELFTLPFFPNQKILNETVLDAKRRNVERAISEYCSDLLLPQGLVKSCSTPPPDAALPGPEETCLGQAWGGGGDGGVAFDDGASLIGVNGLFFNLQVAQVVFQAGPTSVQDYVQSIQLILQMGDDTWPLPRHGALGNPEQITYAQGTKINSVLVQYCSYVNSLTFYTDSGDKQLIGGSKGGCESHLVNFQEVVRGQLGFNTRKAWLVGLMGRSEKWVNKIGFYFAYTVPNGQSCQNSSSDVSSAADGALVNSTFPTAGLPKRNQSLLRGSASTPPR